MKHVLIYLIAIFISSNAFAQIVINSAPTANDLVTNTLVGSGVTVSNITFIGNANQKGYFNGSTSNIGLPSGVVLSSGNVNNIVPPANPSTDYFGAGDADLLATAQSVSSNPNAGNITSTHDAAVLEFDFVPTGDEVTFSFVFASEEYTTWINSVYNDAFGFFLNGPNPLGGNYTNENLALVPGTSEPITISTIHPGLNAAYYISNSGGTHSFNGFTVPIEIQFDVICGETYHFKFAVADCEDGTLDTGVFLEGGSFSSNSITVESTSSVTNSFTDTLLAENCVTNTLQFIRPVGSDTIADTLPLIISGTVDVMTDLASFMDTIFFPIGVTTVDLVIDPIEDFIAEGMEYIEIGFYNITVCGDTLYDSILLYIVDNYPMTYDLVDTVTSDCITLVDQVEVLNFANSLPPYSVLWDFGSGSNPTDLPFLPNENDTVTYYATITDGCGDVWYDSVVHYVDPQDLTYDLVDTVIVPCVGDSNYVEAMNFANAPGPYSFSWSFGSNSNPTLLPVSTSNGNTNLYYLTITDACGREYLDSVYHIIDQTLQIDTMISYPSASCDPTGAVSGFASGITGTPYYNWTGPGPNSPNFIDATVWQNLSPGWYYFTVTDNVCEVNDSIMVDTEPGAVANGSASPNYGCAPLDVTFSNTSQNAVSYEWIMSDGSSILMNNQNSVYETLYGSAGILLIATDALGCTDTAYIHVAVDPCGCTDPLATNYNPLATIENGSCIYPTPEVVVPNVFTPNGDGDNDLFILNHLYALEIELVILNRWGNVLYESKSPNPAWDGKLANGEFAHDGTYFYRYTAIGVSGEEISGHGFFMLLRD